jgi:hypothetical protein
VGAQQEVIAVAGGELEHAGVAVEDDRAAIGASRDVLDARDRTGGEVRAHSLPVKWTVERESQEEAAVGGEPVGFAAASAQHARRLPEELPAGAVELAQAPEAGHEGDLCDREVGVVQQPTGEVHPRRPRQPVGRHPEVVGEEAPKVPWRNAETCA